MNEQDIETFKTRLLNLKAELKEAAETSKESTKPVELDQASVGRLSRMDAMQVQQMAQEVARRREQQLIKIEAALRRMNLGDFGYCYVCGEEIDIRRLSIDPAFTRCLGYINR